MEKGEKRIYRIKKARQRERKELGNIDNIKDMEGKMLFDEDKISLRWAEYFEELLTVKNKREEITEMYKVEGPEKGIEVEQMREAMSGMKSNKAPGVSEVSIDMLRAGGEECLIWKSDLLKAVWDKEKIPENWRKSLIVPIFKKKGDILECGNYRGIKLLEHGLKILERILEKYGLKMNAKKTETMVCSKNGEKQVNIRDMHGEELKQVKSFKYLRSLINNKGGCEKEVQARVLLG